MNILQATKATNTQFIQDLLSSMLLLKTDPYIDPETEIVYNDYTAQKEFNNETFVLVVSVPVTEIMHNNVNWDKHKNNAQVIRL